MGQRGGTTPANIIAVLVIAAVVFWAYYFVPPYMVRYKMGDVIAQSLETWKETGRENKAEERLIELLEEKHIPDYLTRRDCQFAQRGMFRHLRCSWQVLVTAPVLGETWLNFEVYKYLDADGFMESGDHRKGDEVFGR